MNKRLVEKFQLNECPCDLLATECGKFRDSRSTTSSHNLFLADKWSNMLWWNLSSFNWTNFTFILLRSNTNTWAISGNIILMTWWFVILLVRYSNVKFYRLNRFHNFLLLKLVNKYNDATRCQTKQCRKPSLMTTIMWWFLHFSS